MTMQPDTYVKFLQSLISVAQFLQFNSEDLYII